MRKDDYRNIPRFCVMCNKPIPPPPERKWDAITCSKECTVQRKNYGRSRLDQTACRYCYRPSSPEERLNYSRWRRWIKTYVEDSIEGRMTHQERIRRAAALASKEVFDNPKHWMYLSFSGPDQFNGAVFIEAHGFITAILRCNDLGINPGGEVLGMDVPTDSEEHLPAEEYRNRVLSLEDLKAAGQDPLAWAAVKGVPA